jgi:hypothetical protein
MVFLLGWCLAVLLAVLKAFLSVISMVENSVELKAGKMGAGLADELAELMVAY